MAAINYISLTSAQEIHRLTITHSGGGVYEHLDLGRLDSVLTNIQNDDYYPTFVDKLTHLFYCTCQFHCFADGNKRLEQFHKRMHISSGRKPSKNILDRNRRIGILNRIQEQCCVSCLLFPQESFDF